MSSSKHFASSSHCSSRRFGFAKGLGESAVIDCSGMLIASGRCQVLKSVLERKSSKTEFDFFKPDAVASALLPWYRHSRASSRQSSHAWSYR